MKAWRYFLIVVLLFAGLAASFADARGRSGGGFGGSRSFRTPSTSRPYSSPGRSFGGGVTNNYYNRGGGFGFPSFFFIPFFGFGGGGYGYGGGGGFLGGLLNLILIIAVIAFIVWLVRRIRRR